MSKTEDPIDPNFPEKLLRTATVQEIQLELFRRSAVEDRKIDAFISVLLANRHLWQGAIIDHLGVNEGGHWIQPSSMIKLRDIEQNFWNADTLYVLCRNSADAHTLVACLPMAKFGCMPNIEDDRQIVDRALGGKEKETVIVRFWWD